MAVTGATRLLVVGVNHRSSSASLRERLFFEPSETRAVLESLREKGLASALALATCDRVEIVAVHDDPGRAADIILDALAIRNRSASRGAPRCIICFPLRGPWKAWLSASRRFSARSGRATVRRGRRV